MKNFDRMSSTSACRLLVSSVKVFMLNTCLAVLLSRSCSRARAS